MENLTSITQDDGVTVLKKGLKLPEFSVATLPAAAKNTDVIVKCSNGAGGSECLAISNGTNWLRIALGAAVAAA